MNVITIMASFGGGLIGAYLGALPVFIMTGIMAIIGSAVAMATGNDVILNYVAFGPYLGPHITFAAGVAAAAYSKRKGYMGDGKDLTVPLFSLNKPDVLLVGGVFGVLGCLLHYICGTVIGLNTDLPGIAVVILAILTRVILGNTGIIGSVSGKEERRYTSVGSAWWNVLLLGAGLGIAIGGIYEMMVAESVSPTIISNYAVLCFGIAATTLIFVSKDRGIAATHHIAIIAALATVASQNGIMGIAFGVLAALLGDTIDHVFNGCGDTHIDPPAFTIVILTIVINVMFGDGLFV